MAPRDALVAADLFARAVALTSPGDPERDTLLADEATALLWSGRGLEAEAICREIIGRPHEGDLDEVVWPCLVFALLARGRVNEALRQADEAIALPGMSDDGRVRLHAWRSTALPLVGDLDGALESARIAATEGDRVGDELSAAIGVTAHAFVARFRGRYGESLALARDGVERADRSPGQLAHRFQILQILATCLADADQFIEARAAIERGRTLSERLGAPWNLALYDLAFGVIDFQTGHWDEALRAIAASSSQGEGTGTQHGSVLAHAIVALVAVHRGDRTRARDEVTAGVELDARSGGQWGQHTLTLARSLVLEADGELERAFRTLDVVASMRWRQGVRSDVVELAPDLVRMAAAAGHMERAREVADQIDLVTAGEPADWLRAVRLVCRGVVEDDATVLAGAADLYGSADRPLERAQALELAGASAMRAGETARARPLLVAAIDIADALDAPRIVDRVGSRLRAAGARRRYVRRPARPRFGWDSLTEAERRVIALVAEGRSNPDIARQLFVSRHTVHSHVAHVLTKLDLRSRVELAAEAVRREATAPPS